MVDANGLPIRLALAPGHQHDSLSAATLLDGVQEGGMLLADKAYDSDAITRSLPQRYSVAILSRTAGKN